MTTTRKFDDRTHWDVWDKYHGVEGWSKPGWALPGDPTRYIGLHDPCWDRVLNRARAAYGDPNIHYNTNTNIGEERWLVFGDGTRLPADGSLAYHDSYTKKTYLLNDDGSVVPLDANGQGGQAFLPAGFRKAGDGKYAPIDPTAQQVAPLLDNPPPSANGYHDEKGVLTPKNAHGDYYVDDPATRKRAYYDGAGHPISEQQFRDGANTSAGAPGGQALPTDEQQSGRAADAVKKLQDELKNRYSHISAAEEQLSEALLNAHATTAEGQRKLNDIQKKIVEAVNNPALSLDTPAGEEAFLTFLRTQVAAIGDVLVSGTLSADDQSKAIAALSNLYAADQGDTGSPSSPGAGPPAQSPPGPSEPSPSPATPATASPEVFDPGPESAEPMPDPTLSDLGLGGLGAPVGPDPLSSLASALPAAMSAIPPAAGLGSTPLDPLSGLASAAAPLAGLASQLGDRAGRDGGDSKDTSGHNTDSRDETDTGDPKDQGQQRNRSTRQGQEPPPPQPSPSANPGDGAPAGAQAAAPAPATSVQLPDGSTATARTPALAQAVKAYLAGTPVDAAYRQAGIELPPPGTPVTNPLDPSALSCGAIGMFKDHYVVAVSSLQALHDGQVVPLASVASGPDFLGWLDPSALRAPAPTPPAAPPTPPAAAPAPAGPPG